MDFQVQPTADALDADTVVVPLHDGPDSCPPMFAAAAAALYRTGELPLKPHEILVLHGERRTVFAGIPRNPDGNDWRRLAAAVVRRMKKAEAIAFMAGDPSALTEGALVGSLSVELHKTSTNSTSARRVILVGGDLPSVERGRIIGESINWARRLVMEPSNLKPPRIVAEHAREMAGTAGLDIEVLDENGIRENKMGALLGVSQGSQEPPRLVVLKYAGDPGSTRFLGLVGKGITFDTGGISLKPADGMEKMKYDMAGGASVMAALRALSMMHARVNCIAVVPLAENMPGGAAQKPGDVVRTMSGKTIEIINTDAEGRLVLADAIAFARNSGATHLVDIATLTGACRIALGSVRAAVLGNNQPFIDAFMAASRRASEKMWQMPLDDEYRDVLKSSVADIVNTGGRWGGVITAAKFLQEFVGQTPWVHLDIAGTAWNDEEKAYLPKGPTGVGIRTLIEFGMTFGVSNV